LRNSSACLRVGAAVAGYDVDGGQNLRLGEIGVEVEVRRGVVAEAHQGDSRLSTDVHPVDETTRHPQRQLVVGLGASRHVKHQRKVHGTPAFCTPRPPPSISRSLIDPSLISSRELLLMPFTNYISRESYRRREMCIGYARLCLCVCLSAAACPHYCTDPDVNWGNGRRCSIVVHCLADLRSMHRLRCYDIDNVAPRVLAIGVHGSTAANAKCQRVRSMPGFKQLTGT